MEEDFVVVFGVAGDFKLSNTCKVEIWVYWFCGEGGAFGVPAFGMCGGSGRCCSLFFARSCLSFSVVVDRRLSNRSS